MSNTDHLAALVRKTLKQYVVSSFNARLFYLEDADAQIFTVLVVPFNYKERPHIMLMAEIVDEKVFIIIDRTDRPLEEYLEDAGIPREQVLITYLGQTQAHL